MSEANKLVTHKFIHDKLMAIKDLRRTDRTVILFKAIELSFMPTSAEMNIKYISEEYAWIQRMSALERPSWLGSWLWPRRLQEEA